MISRHNQQKNVLMLVTNLYLKRRSSSGTTKNFVLNYATEWSLENQKICKKSYVFLQRITFTKFFKGICYIALIDAQNVVRALESSVLT